MSFSPFLCWRYDQINKHIKDNVLQHIIFGELKSDGCFYTMKLSMRRHLKRPR
jgi:hypothetical protein